MPVWSTGTRSSTDITSELYDSVHPPRARSKGTRGNARSARLLRAFFRMSRVSGTSSARGRCACDQLLFLDTSARFNGVAGVAVSRCNRSIGRITWFTNRISIIRGRATRQTPCPLLSLHEGNISVSVESLSVKYAKLRARADGKRARLLASLVVAFSFSLCVGHLGPTTLYSIIWANQCRLI